MCSIAGITGEDTYHDVDKMIDFMTHRAPDDKGIYRDKFISLGIGRLKIIDLYSKNLCPYENEKIVLSFNGEIYNYKSLRGILSKRGYKFYTKSDTEVLANSWIEWGEKIFDKLDGMYAFAIYEKKNKLLYLARDIPGEKPLYYGKFGNKLYFASEAKALRKILPLKRKNDEFFETFQHCLSETLWQNVYQIPAANYLRYDLKNGKIRLFEHWKLKKRKINIKTCEEELEDLLKNSIKLRTQSDVPYGLYYSKGIDSSLISTFHNFKNKFYFDDQKNWKKDFTRNILKITEHLDFPVGSLSSYPLWKLAQITNKKKIKVILSGEGADEIFGGYVRYMPMYTKWELYKRFGSYKFLFDKFYPEYAKGFSALTVRNKNVQLVNRLMLPFFEEFEDPINAMGYFDFKVIMPSLLQMGDRMSAAFGIENRCPFLDKKIIEFGFNLPPKLKINSFYQKILLRSLLKKRGLSQPLSLEKKGLTILFNKWFKKNDWDRSYYFALLKKNWINAYNSKRYR